MDYQLEVELLTERVKYLAEGVARNPQDYGMNKARRMQRLKLAMYEEQEGKCCFCKRLMFSTHRATGFSKTNLATFEHIICQVNGGTHARENIRLSCYTCNNKRELMDFDKYARLFEGRTPQDAWQLATAIHNKGKPRGMSRNARQIEDRQTKREAGNERFANDPEYRASIFAHLERLADNPKAVAHIKKRYNIGS